MSDIALVYLILAAAVVLFVSGRVPVGVVAIGVALALWATGILSLNAALSGFGDPTVLFIASLFVVSAPSDSLAKLQTRFKLDEDVYRQQYGRLSDKKKPA